MTENLLAILLCTTSAKGSSLVFQWPPHPKSSPRLKRALPINQSSLSQLDNPWRASQPYQDVANSSYKGSEGALPDDYLWNTPSHRDRSVSVSHSSSPPSGKSTPIEVKDMDSCDTSTSMEEYDSVIGYSSEFLASMVCPKRTMCHQKFELIVDDLAFIGHPVCSDGDQVWRYKQEKSKHGSRGREARNRRSSRGSFGQQEGSRERASSNDSGKQMPASWLQLFQFCLVVDLPDTASSASGNVSKYMDVIYEQIAFVVTAVLFREQVEANFVETECERLGALRDTCLAKGDPFTTFASLALSTSSIAQSMKLLFEAITSSQIAYITLNDIPMELQLPPYLSSLLSNATENDDELDFVRHPDEDEYCSWDDELSVGWRLPALAPWKSVMLLETPEDFIFGTNLESPYIGASDRPVAEGLVRFLEIASVNLTLAELATLLDWDLDLRVFPTVRWLVLHRRAKVIDVVHASLRTIYTLPAKFDSPLAALSSEFYSAFGSNPDIPPLPEIMSAISSSSNTTFFAAVVHSKDLLPLFTEVLKWMLKHDLLVVLHLRVRVVATAQLKAKVRTQREKSRRSKRRVRDQERAALTSRGRAKVSTTATADDDGEGPWLPLSPKGAHTFSRRISSKESGKSTLSELHISSSSSDIDRDGYGGVDDHAFFDEDEYDMYSEEEEEDSKDEEEEHSTQSTIIPEPGKANRVQRRWLAAMSDGKDSGVARRFKRINQFFDGKKTDDEILYRADISRRELREVLHVYDDYVQTFLHPS